MVGGLGWAGFQVGWVGETKQGQLEVILLQAYTVSHSRAVLDMLGVLPVNLSVNMQALYEALDRGVRK